MSDIQQLLNDINILYERKKNIKLLLELLDNKTEVDIIPIIKSKIINNNVIPPGIRNHGNTCFHNCAIQLIYRIKEFSDFIINDNIKNQYEDEKVKGVIQLLKNMKQNSNTYANIKHDNIIIHDMDLIKYTTCTIIPTYEIGSQDDAGSFIEVFLKRISIDCSNENKDGWQYSIPFDKLCAEVDIVNDGKSYKIHKPVYDFKENDPRTYFNIKYLMKNYSTTKELNDINNIFKMDNDLLRKLYEDKIFYNNNDEITSFLSIAIKNRDTRSVTEILKYNYNNTIESIIEKVNSGIDPEQVIVLDPNEIKEYKLFFRFIDFIPNKYVIFSLKIYKQINVIDSNTGNIGSVTLEKLSHKIRLADNDGYITILNSSDKYELVGFIAHRGIYRGGHYISYIKYGELWYIYNDSNVSSVSNWDKVYDDMEFTPYVLLYRKQSDKTFEYLEPISSNLMDYLQKV